ncbi:transmembrane protein 82-like [Thalassophryne amazonica]|uniref:transmembrane protein 82-like n=1 Tax=Thalassophryne amazonica TaxID=390379 RepID=UPI001471C298|nr:transmembrane protein 82-like [Thalassophryne amazonica]
MSVSSTDTDDSQTENGRNHRSGFPVSPLNYSWKTALQFWCLTVILSLVGSRVSSLIVLEFVLRAVSSWASPRLDATSRGPHLLLIQCQFSLGCGLTCTLIFLHEGAPHSSLSLFLAAALSWALADYCHSLWNHAARLYPLHSSQRYCGKCITLLTSGHTILASLQKVVVLAFTVATVAGTATVCDHFLSQKDALKFWTPLTLCYAMLVVYMQEEQDRQTVADALLNSVVLRLGALLVLMLLMGYWSDVFQILISFLGEAVCLLPCRDLLQPTLKVHQIYLISSITYLLHSLTLS